MEKSQEFEIGLNLIRKVLNTLREIAECEDFEEVKSLVESVKHPLANALFQMKNGRGPMRDEFIEVLVPVVSQMRELNDLETLKVSVSRLLSLVERLEE